MLQTEANHALDRGSVLTKALLRTLGILGLSGREAGRIIGMSEATISRMRNGAFALEEGSKPFELAALLVRAFRSLDAITGGDEKTARTWLRSPNTTLGVSPIERMFTVEGLVDVVAYLDARRAPI
ncbi:MAG TPA: antitoxin Xre/MbcA/ParS toxin-binding domain-containing protein [Paracoccaceae bacterium]|nr:antitoxin Xre/MbcA/ParS toxin-binding domain-containing protein [Paracoccaceae bacterium]